MLAERYGRQGQSQRVARSIIGQLQNSKIGELFQSGLHEFVEEFIAHNNNLGEALANQYLH